MTISKPCPLCNGTSEDFFQWKKRIWYTCTHCHAIFPPNDLIPDKAAEKSRYEEHHNDVNNPGYQNFVSPIVEAVKTYFTEKHHGLDFGAGTGPVAAKLLFDENYKVELYDPFFHYHPHLLQLQYDYILSCEVVEHFHNPAKEFAMLKNLLKENGKLFCMTTLYNDEINFKTWNYKDDSTHVFIYRLKTFEYIQKTFDFSDLRIEKNLIILSA